MKLFNHQKQNQASSAPIDAQNELIEKIAKSSNDFEFVQMDKSIHDARFQTKPSSFFKDAMHRFVKNRSSVVASVILGILIAMAILVPAFDTAQVGQTAISQEYQAALPPRWGIFKGTGFLDGTTWIEDVVGGTYDSKTATFGGITAETALTDIYPTGKYMAVDDAVMLDTIQRTEITTSSASEYGYGGSLGVTCGNHIDNATFFTPTAKFKTANNYSLSIGFDSEAIASKGVEAKYRVYANVVYTTGTTTNVTLVDWTTDYSEIQINDLSSLVKAGNPDKTSARTEFNASFGVELATTKGDSSTYPSLYFTKFVFKPGTGSDTTWTAYSFTDANECRLRDTSTVAATNALSWKVDGYAVKSIRNVHLVKCAFRYDNYTAAFGEVTKSLPFSIDPTTYINNGWMSLDVTAADPVSTFKILDDRCPLRSVSEVKVETTPIKDSTGKTVYVKSYTVIGKVSMYRSLGLSGIPSFIFGTDNHGWDYFKYLFSGLRTSLFLGVLCALINISFGLLWGSISGYFGGWTDLIMERLTEILGGVPWIVVMTLCVLNLGQNFWVFLLALCLTGWIGVASTTRSQFYRFKGREYVLASRTLGANDARLIFRHILPNSLGTLITGAVLMIPSVIFSEATISYLGLGLKGTNSFGVALSEAQGFLQTEPYLIIFGSIIVSLLMISFNLFGNGLRDAFNPSLKGSDE